MVSTRMKVGIVIVVVLAALLTFYVRYAKANPASAKLFGNRDFLGRLKPGVAVIPGTTGSMVTHAAGRL